MNLNLLIKKIKGKILKHNNNIEELYNFILETFELMNSRVLSVKIIYSQLRLFNQNLFDKIADINNYDEFWNYLKKNYGNKLYFNKPFISDISFTNTLEVTENYLRTLDFFDNKKINEFESKIGLESSKGSTVFINKLSDDFVQVDETLMIKKEIFNIDNFTLKRIKDTLNLYFKNNELLDTRKFNAYFTFPNIKNYKWNKYLLAGITRTYFNKDFYVDKVMNNNNYIIRRV